MIHLFCVFLLVNIDPVSEGVPHLDSHLQVVDFEIDYLSRCSYLVNLRAAMNSPYFCEFSHSAFLGSEGACSHALQDPEVAMQRFTEEMAKEQNPKTLALLYTYRSLARELARRPPPEAEQDRDMANTWAASDPEIQKQIQNVRKWIPIGHRVRGDPLAQQQAEGTDFLLSFTTADKAANDPLLVRLNNGSVRFEGGYRRLTWMSSWVTNLMFSWDHVPKH
jgi:hypothetical protein